MLWWATVASLPVVPDGIREYALGKIGGADEDWSAGDDADPMALMIEAGTKHFSAELPTPALLTDAQAGLLDLPIYVAIAGRDSLAGGEKAAERAETLLPTARVQTWPDATHSLPMQEADPLNVILNEFWNESEG